MKTKTAIVISLVLLTISCKKAVNKEEVKTNSEVQTTDIETTKKQEFSKTLTWENTIFEVNILGDTLLRIQPKGLEISNDPFFYDILGSTIVDAQIVDIDGDKHAEILVYLVSDGSGSYGNVIGYSVNNGKSMSEIFYNPEGDTNEVKTGYMGHDSFSVKGNKLERRFPIYKENDTNANPTGGERVIQYKLIKGNNGKLLVIDKMA